MQTLGDVELTRRVPAGSVDHQDHLMVGAGAGELSELIERELEGLDRDRGHEEPEGLAVRWSNEGVDVQPVVAGTLASNGTASARDPGPAKHRFQSESRFVLGPD